jgi:hypothetical protein
MKGKPRNHKEHIEKNVNLRTEARKIKKYVM